MFNKWIAVSLAGLILAILFCLRDPGRTVSGAGD